MDFKIDNKFHREVLHCIKNMTYFYFVVAMITNIKQQVDYEYGINKPLYYT